VEIVDAAILQRAGQRGLGEAGPPRRRDGSDVENQLNAGDGQLVEEFGQRLALVADREEGGGAAQSNSSSRKLLRRFL
jgi:hypothetical protein